MSTPPRLTRPIPTRAEPVRRWMDPGPVADGRPATGSDAVANAVDLGYRVLDESIQRAQHAAERLGIRPERTDAAVDELQELATRMARYTSDVFGVWSQFIEVAFNRSAPDGARTPGEPRAPATPRATPGAGARTTVAVRVQSPHAVEVTVDLSAHLLMQALTVQPVQSPVPDRPRLAAVHFVPATAMEPARVEVEVPSEHPAGTYTGVVVDDATGGFAGTISVTVLPAHP